MKLSSEFVQTWHTSTEKGKDMPALDLKGVLHPPQTTRAHLALSVTWMMNRIWVEALKLIRREQNASLVAFYLSKEVLLLIIVSRCHISCRKTDIFLFRAVTLLHRKEHRPQCWRETQLALSAKGSKSKFQAKSGRL